MEAAMGMYQEMASKRILPDVIAFTALIDGHCKTGNMKEAFRLHNEMLEAGVTPNVFTVSCLIVGLCKDRRTSEALELFLAKTRAGSSYSETNVMDSSLSSPNHVMYTALIQGLCKVGQVFKATKLLSDMRFYGLQPDVFTYGAMLQGHFQAKHIIDLMMLQADMIKIGLIRTTCICRILARGYLESGYRKSVFNLSEYQMKIRLANCVSNQDNLQQGVFLVVQERRRMSTNSRSFFSTGMNSTA